MTKLTMTSLLGLLLVAFGYAQTSPDCSTAVPICNNTPVNGGTSDFGVDDFGNATRSGCLEKTVSGHIESNSAWYRFRTNASGQLGFNLGFDSSEDWDFALYKTSDCSNLGDPVRCNFFDNRENSSYAGIGVDPTTGQRTIQYEDWLQVEPGEDYYLLVNNFSNHNSGFSIQFTGTLFEEHPYDALDCSIVDNLLGPPVASCEGETVQLNATTPTATSYTWYRDSGSGFQELVGENGATLDVTQSAFYRVVVTTSSSNVLSEVQVAFSQAPVAQSPSDVSLCMADGAYDLSQKDTEILGAQSKARFRVSYHGSLQNALMGFNPLDKNYEPQVGMQHIYVRLTALENPDCFDASQEFELTAIPSPQIDFPLEAYSCGGNPITIGDATPEGDCTYLWDTGATTPTIAVGQAGEHQVVITRTIAGHSCVTTASIQVFVSMPPQIMEVQVEDLQKHNTVTVVMQAEGDYDFQLDGGPIQESNIFKNVIPGNHQVTITDRNGCGSVEETITVVGFPKYFSPNGDGVNDRWDIVGMEQLDNPILFIFDRYGKLLGQLNQNSQGWNGSINGKLLPASDYWFKLTYLDDEGNRVEAKFIKNHFALQR